jgi:hypothetical protein
VVTVRAAKLAIANEGYHLSVAEGMFAADVEACIRPLLGMAATAEDRNIPSVVATSVRGLSDELGLEAGTHYDLRQLRCLGLLFDMQRLQPYFVFFLKTKKVDLETVRECWKGARDCWEIRDILDLTWDKQTARRLVRGEEIFYKGRPVALASNHARAGFMLAACHLLRPERETIQRQLALGTGTSQG